MKLLIKCLLYLTFLNCCSQSATPVVQQKKVSTILGDSVSLQHFFEALDALKTDPSKTLSIVHIGDSHIQADYFSGMLRVLLQEKFGNAGRGLIFPYKIAHTNEPVNYSSSSMSEWKGVRNVLNPENRPLGVSGITAFSKSTTADFTMHLKDQKSLNYAFNRIDLFSEASTPKNTRLINSEGMVGAAVKESGCISTFHLKDTTHHISFQFSGFNAVDVHGLVLRNNQGGILYHTIGVNGATFKSYNASSLFMEQLRYLKPDLIIISLGTNESYAPNFNLNELNDQVHVFMDHLRAACNPCSILFTSPSDNCKLRKGKVVSNDNPKKIGSYFKNYAETHHHALWNLYEVMGGEHSMRQWKKQGLAAKDYVHFTRKGYELQGTLLFEALMAAYEECHSF